jgi:hypothetical protein
MYIQFKETINDTDNYDVVHEGEYSIDFGCISVSVKNKYKEIVLNGFYPALASIDEEYFFSIIKLINDMIIKPLEDEGYRVPLGPCGSFGNVCYMHWKTRII